MLGIALRPLLNNRFSANRFTKILQCSDGRKAQDEGNEVKTSFTTCVHRGVIESTRKGWRGYIARIREVRNAYKTAVGNLNG